MNGRSIQDIVPPARSKPIRPPPIVQKEPPTQPPVPQQYSPMTSEPKQFSFLWLALGGVVVAVLVVVLMSTVFHTATADVTLSEWSTDVSATYNAGGDATLTYSPVSVSAEASRTVAATGSIDAKDRASGTIMVSNLYSAKSQRLITNTRFETPEGKIYRIHSPITVPGYTTRSGKKIAGTVEATVFADQPGETYNADSATFMLPGLKGSSQYELITATTKSPLAGGFVGTRATVEKSVRDQALADIKAELDRSLREKVTSTAPPATVIFPDSIAIQYSERPDTASGDQAVVSIVGTATAPAFPEDGLALALASQAQVASDAPLSLLNPGEIRYTEVGGLVASGGSLSFTLSGTAHIRASFNPQKFAEDIAGKTKIEADGVRSGYRGISGTTEIRVRPFWLSSLPKNPERITVVVHGALDPTH